jgi:hypothetical protein
MPMPPKMWTPSQAAEWEDTRREPRPIVVTTSEFEPVELLDVDGTIERLRAAGVRADAGGLFRRMDVKRIFPPRRGRPVTRGPRYPLDRGEYLGVDPTSKRRFAPPSAGRIEGLARLIRENAPMPLAELATLYNQVVVGKNYKPARPETANGFPEAFKLALDHVEKFTDPEFADRAWARAHATSWRAAQPKRGRPKP